MGCIFSGSCNDYSDSSSSYSLQYCDNEYNVSSCANTSLTGEIVYGCRGFMSCANSEVSTSWDLFCGGDRACKNVDFTNDAGLAMYSYGYQGADSMTLLDDVYYVYCFGYQSCLDVIFDQSSNENDATAYGYQAMYNTYIDYSNTVNSNGYEGLYYATVNTTSVSSDTMDVVIYGYYGSYETDVLCQDGVTCNFYAYGYYATEETYLYCLPGSTCNVYCGETNGCVGMNMYCYSTATCYFDCDDATECPSESDAYSLSVLSSLTKEEKADGKKRYTDDQFNQIMAQRLDRKAQKQSEYKKERAREEKQYMQSASQHNNNNNAQQSLKTSPIASNNLESTLIESGILLIAGAFFGVLGRFGYKKCVARKDYRYQSIV